MSELVEYAELSAEAKTHITEEQYEKIREAFELNEDGHAQLKKPLDLSM